MRRRSGIADLSRPVPKDDLVWRADVTRQTQLIDQSSNLVPTLSAHAVASKTPFGS
jgi:hypothetical protein